MAVSAALAAAALAGCASETLTEGVKLAQAGQSAARQMQENASLSAETLTALRRAAAFNDGYANGAGSTASAGFLGHMTSIQGKLEHYATVLDSLASAYAALGDLAAYDSSGAFATSIQSLATDTQAFASAVKAPVSIPAEVTQGLALGGGLALRHGQARRVKAASAKIEVVLKQVIAVLETPHVRDELVPAQDQAAGVIDQASDTLLVNGVYGFGPIVDKLGAPMGLTSNDTTEARLAANTSAMEKVRAGLRNVAVELAAERSAQAGASYDASLKTLKALVPMHDKLARGAPLDPAQIASATAELKTLAVALKPSASDAAQHGK